MVTIKNPKKRWTTEEEKVVYKQVSLHPENLTLAFKKAAELLGRTESSIAGKWYTDLKFRNSVSFATVGQSGAYRNSKVNGTKTKLTKGFWQRIKDLFK